VSDRGIPLQLPQDSVIADRHTRSRNGEASAEPLAVRTSEMRMTNIHRPAADNCFPLCASDKEGRRDCRPAWPQHGRPSWRTLDGGAYTD
jgi:hypothetical protein